MKKMRPLLLIVLFLLPIFITVIAPAQPTQAHRDGCHRWHSCPSDTGSYVCGDTGHYSECPSATPVTPKPALPRVPVITKETVTASDPIPFEAKTEVSYREYQGYKYVRVGNPGERKIHTEVTYTDGSESSRQELKREEARAPQPEVTIIGQRIKPQAKIVWVTKTKKADKYAVWGQYKPGKEVVLAVDDKRIKRTKTDKNGWFVFPSIKLKKDVQLKIYKRENNKENQISEKTYLQLKTLKLTTEYQTYTHEK
jgi:hypothetical protein